MRHGPVGGGRRRNPRPAVWCLGRREQSGMFYRSRNSRILARAIWVPRPPQLVSKSWSLPGRKTIFVRHTGFGKGLVQGIGMIRGHEAITGAEDGKGERVFRADVPEQGQGLGATSCYQAVKEQHNNPAADSQGQAPQVKSREIAEPEERAEIATYDRSHDPQHDGGDDSSRCFPRHQVLRQKTGNEAEHDPRDDPHTSPLSMALNKCVCTGLPSVGSDGLSQMNATWGIGCDCGSNVIP